MLITGIIYTKQHRATCVATNVITLAEILQSSAVYTQVVILLNTNETTTLIIDLLKLADGQSFSANNITDWASLITFLENFDLLEQYITKTVIPMNMKNRVADINNAPSYQFIEPPMCNTTDVALKIVSLENNADIDVGFCNRINMETVFKDAQWYVLPDLLFVKKKSSVINFDNTIPFINGAACYSEIYTGSLLTHNGRLVLDKTSAYNKNIVFVDFTPYGALKKIPLWQCTDSIVQRGTTTSAILPFEKYVYSSQADKVVMQARTQEITVPNTEYRIEFTTPPCAVSSFPMLSICGSFFLPGANLSMQRQGDCYRVMFKITRSQLLVCIAAGLQRISSYIPNTTLMAPSADLVLNTLFQNHTLGSRLDTGGVQQTLQFLNSTQAFLSMITSDTQLVINEIAAIDVLPEYLKFKPGVGGLLMNKTTGEIVDYVRSMYDDHTGVYPITQKPLQVLRYDFNTAHKDNIVFEHRNQQGVDEYNKFDIYDEVRRLSNYVLIDIIRRPT